MVVNVMCCILCMFDVNVHLSACINGRCFQRLYFYLFFFLCSTSIRTHLVALNGIASLERSTVYIHTHCIQFQFHTRKLARVYISVCIYILASNRAINRAKTENKHNVAKGKNWIGFNVQGFVPEKCIAVTQ